MERTLAYYKKCVVDLQQTLRTSKTEQWQCDVFAALRYAKAKVKVIENKVGVGLLLGVVLLSGCEKEPIRPVVPRTEKEAAYRTIEANVSAYCACAKCCGKWADGVTASGRRIQPGDKFVAADKRYAFGTWMTIDGYGRVQVLDRGGAIKGDKLDTYHETHQAALQWGRQYLEVKVEIVQ